ncbi:unnamed protein product [Prorocentrum cordatum]|uniref:Vinculin n=1 Tax=Prorocentrum cordatum TaxID=2364126 RepID=A0ABN9QHL7_9DINO|nr:unnamed protein product [Polarella glacialis]
MALATAASLPELVPPQRAALSLTQRATCDSWDNISDAIARNRCDECATPTPSPRVATSAPAAAAGGAAPAPGPGGPGLGLLVSCGGGPRGGPHIESADGRAVFRIAEHMDEEVSASRSQETIKNSIENQCLSAATEAIDDIPEQLSSVVQNKVESLAESVKTTLLLVQMAIRSSCEDEDLIDVAIDQLDKIPDIIRNVFASKMMEANGAIRMKLSAVMQRIKSITPESQDMVTQMWTIPEELEKITSEAIDQAVQDSKREATKQCDHVLRTLPQAAAVSRQALEDTAVRITEAISEMFFETMRALRRTTAANVKHAVAYVDDPGDVAPTKCSTSDARPRAKMHTVPRTDGAPTSWPRHGAAGRRADRRRGGGAHADAPAGLDAGAKGVWLAMFAHLSG